MSGVTGEIRHYIEARVALGFAPPDAIAEDASDLFGDEEGVPADTEIRRMVDDCVRAYLVAQAERTGPGDAERLDAAFRELDERGILARHYYGCTRTDGASSILREQRAAVAGGRTVRGYVYYTMQDADDLERGQLCLAWGPFSEPGTTRATASAHAKRIAEEVVGVLEGHGVRVEWDGNPNTTLVVRDLTWRAPRDPVTGAPLLHAGERLEPIAPPPRERYEVTSEGEWLIRIVYATLDGIAAHANLVRLHQSMAGGGFQKGPVSPKDVDPNVVASFDFVPLALKEVEGRRTRFELTAMTMSPFLGRTWRDLTSTSDGLVLVATDRAQFDEARQLLSDIRLPPMVVQLEGSAWKDADVDAVRATHASAIRTSVIADGAGAFDVIRAIAKPTLADLVRHVRSRGAGAAPSRDAPAASSQPSHPAPDRQRDPSHRPWWKLWGHR